MFRKHKLGLTLFGGILALIAGVGLARSNRKHPSSRERHRIGYPPFDTPKQIGDGIWIVDSGPLRAMGMVMPVRMTIIRLGSGELLLHSPVQLSTELAGKVKALGQIGHLVAPSTGHWTFIADWQHAFPDAKTWAVPGLRDRPQVRKSDLRIDRELGDSAPEDWGDEVEQGLISGGAGFREAYFFHKASHTLVLTDLVDNLETDKLPTMTATVMGIAGATGGTTPIHVRLAIWAAGESARKAIQTMLTLDTERVVLAHGRWFTEREPERLRKAFDWIV